MDPFLLKITQHALKYIIIKFTTYILFIKYSQIPFFKENSLNKGNTTEFI